jgi:ubiquinone/menaquinone biosynthesis C-methylase UbiE
MTHDEMTRKAHWDAVYASKSDDQVSWFQAEPELSLRMVRDTGLGAGARILDVGGGASRLVDRLLEDGHTTVGVIDVAENGLRKCRNRLGSDAESVEWILSDVITWVPSERWDVWHDRAVFHFLVDERDRSRYLHVLKRALASSGHVILATFGPDGPERCSGLPTVRYSVNTMRETLGSGFELEDSQIEEHRTPSGSTQQFLYCRFQRIP